MSAQSVDERIINVHYQISGTYPPNFQNPDVGQLEHVLYYFEDGRNSFKNEKLMNGT